MKSHIAFNSGELGLAFKAERSALGKTQLQVAQAAGYRRQTIVDLEAGKNVSIRTMFAALAAIGKGLSIVDTRPELGDLQSLLDQPDER